MSPLFQTFVLCRNLERPFKNPKMEERQEELAAEDESGDILSSKDEMNEEDAEELVEEEDSDGETTDDETSDDEYDDEDEYDEYDDEED